MKDKKPNQRIKAKSLSPQGRGELNAKQNLVLFYVGVVVFLGLLAGAGYALWPTSKLKDSLAFDNKTPPKLNPNKPPGPAPEGMVYIPGGEFWMGFEASQDSLPLHKVYVDPFWMDKYEVINEEFAKFVKATGYRTVAERKPDPQDFPGAKAEDLREPFSIVFHKPKVKIRNAALAHEYHLWWQPVKGADWQHPEGPGSSLAGKEKHPVVQVCYEDALAYCGWADKRLPTEAEWEFAARGGLDRQLYCWGDELNPGGKWLANIWQGDFPNENTLEDGFAGTAPVGSFPPNGYGLHDMAGNAWEWCADWYQPDYYKDSAYKNPKGPQSGWDPREPETSKRVMRGGSFLCADNYCIRYLPGARGKGEGKSAQNHIGFRCVRDVK